MKKILLVGINARYTHSNLALLYLEKYIHDLDYSVTICEFSINTDIDIVFNSIMQENPDYIGLSVYIWNSEYIKKLLVLLSSLSGKIILGGPEVSYCPETWLSQFPCIAHIVTGHGEEGFRSVVKDTITYPHIVNIPNIHFNDIPMPYSREDILSRGTKYLYYESSRGCPFSCSYCLSAAYDQKYEWKLFPVIKQELELMLSCNPGMIKFVDRTFNAKKSHYREIWKFLLEICKNKHITFHFEIFPELLDQDDFDLLSKCQQGLFQFEIGIQSVHAQCLEAINRKSNWEKAKPSITMLLALQSIHIHLDMIVGLPFSDYAATITTFNEIYALKPDYFQVGFLKVLPGTALFTQSNNYGIVHRVTAPYEIIANNWLTESEICYFKKIADLVDKIYNKGHYRTTLNELQGYFSKPFEMYASFADLLSKNMPGFFTQSNLFENNAAFLIFYTEHTFPDKTAYIVDCLRWDYCLTSKKHFYPQILQYQNNKSIKKEIIPLLKSKYAIAEERLKQCIIFKAETECFSEKFLENNHVAVFFEDKEMYLIR